MESTSVRYFSTHWRRAGGKTFCRSHFEGPGSTPWSLKARHSPRCCSPRWCPGWEPSEAAGKTRAAPRPAGLAAPLSPQPSARGCGSVGWAASGPPQAGAGTWERRHGAGQGAGRDLGRRAGAAALPRPGAPQESSLLGACKGVILVVGGSFCFCSLFLSQPFSIVKKKKNGLPALGERSKCRQGTVSDLTPGHPGATCTCSRPTGRDGDSAVVRDGVRTRG